MWYLNAMKWIDEDDLLYGKREARRKVREFFRDLLVNRPTETHALISLALRALRGYDISKLLKRQMEALFYAQEAKELGLTETTYISEKLGIHRQSAWELLKRIDAKILTSDVFDTYTSNGRTRFPDRIVKRTMKGKPRICAYCGLTTPDGSKPLCGDCHRGIRLNQWSLSADNEARILNWLEPEIERIRQEHRQWALDQLVLQDMASV